MMMDWQKIESAPFNTPILMYQPKQEHHPAVIYISPRGRDEFPTEMWEVLSDGKCRWYKGDFRVHAFSVNPTLWKPLDPPLAAS